MTAVDYAACKQEIFELIKKKKCAPILVRLAWHDAGNYSKIDKTGGPNGSMQHASGPQKWAANSGLNVARELLQPIKDHYPQMSYADLWALAGTTAIEASKGPYVKFCSGRKDCDVTIAEALPDGRLPDADKKADHLRKIFYRMGMDDREIVILSGAHALGRCHPERSGFEGPWMKDPFTFTNEYFGVILHDDFAPSKSSTGQPQFENKSKAGLMMLITDLELRDDPEFRKWTQRYNLFM
eukprot:NODE_31_length_37178_cov_0.413576.p17 type:complete len:240 gc:universal NODE_31_length_37178_cov_0.413576:37030-36311(-)